MDFSDLRDQTEQRLIEFLNADLDLAFTYIKMAQTRENVKERLVQNARKALQAARHFEGRITNKQAWTEIHKRADELERLLSTFKT